MKVRDQEISIIVLINDLKSSIKHCKMLINTKLSISELEIDNLRIEQFIFLLVLLFKKMMYSDEMIISFFENSFGAVPNEVVSAMFLLKMPEV